MPTRRRIRTVCHQFCPSLAASAGTCQTRSGSAARLGRRARHPRGQGVPKTTVESKFAAGPSRRLQVAGQVANDVDVDLQCTVQPLWPGLGAPRSPGDGSSARTYIDPGRGQLTTSPQSTGSLPPSGSFLLPPDLIMNLNKPNKPEQAPAAVDRLLQPFISQTVPTTLTLTSTNTFCLYRWVSARLTRWTS